MAKLKQIEAIRKDQEAVKRARESAIEVEAKLWLLLKCSFLEMGLFVTGTGTVRVSAAVALGVPTRPSATKVEHSRARCTKTAWLTTIATQTAAVLWTSNVKNFASIFRITY